MVVAPWSNVQVAGAMRIRLTPGLTDASHVVSALNQAGLVTAQIDRDALVVRPRNQPTVAGMAMYYGSRPEFRGKVISDDGRAILVGSVDRSGMPAIVSIVGGLSAAFIATAGVMLLASGDLSGIAALLFAVVTGLAVLAGGLMIQRLSRIDEATIGTALAAISDSHVAGRHRAYSG